MEWLSSLVAALTNGYGLLLIVVIAAVGIYLIKKGKLSINTKHVNLGVKDIRSQEAQIRETQWDFVVTYCEGAMAHLPQEVRGTEKAKYIISKVADIYERALIVNHIRRDQAYKNLKMEMIISAVQKRTDMEYFKSDEFYAYAKSFNDRMIDKLVDIREMYEKDC